MPIAAFAWSPPPARHGKLVSLEIARFVGIMMVVIEHYSTTCTSFGMGAPMFRTPGPIFLCFFFLFSGFIIYTIHHQDAGKPRLVLRYVWRRAWRVFPIYWLSLIPMVVVLWHGITLPYLLNNLTATPTAGNFIELNPPAWTLRNEMLYYTLFGLSLLLPYVGRFLLPLWGVFMAWAWYRSWQGFSPPTDFLPSSLIGLGQHFFALLNIFILAGVAAAWVFVRVQPNPRLLWGLLVLSLAVLLPLVWADKWGNEYPATIRVPFAAAALAVLIFSLSALERGGHIRLHPRWEACGIVAYPLYLLHSDISFAFASYFFYHPAAKQDFTAPVMFTIMLVLALIVSWVAAFWFDVPVQRFARRAM